MPWRLLHIHHPIRLAGGEFVDVDKAIHVIVTTAEIEFKGFTSVDLFLYEIGHSIPFGADKTVFDNQVTLTTKPETGVTGFG